VGLFLLLIAAIRYRIKLNVIFLARRGLGSELQIPDCAAWDQKARSPDRFISRLQHVWPGFISGLFVFIPVLTCSSRRVWQLDPGKAARCGSSAAVPMATRYVTCKKITFTRTLSPAKTNFLIY
jgi:hypothetical protein